MGAHHPHHDHSQDNHSHGAHAGGAAQDDQHHHHGRSSGRALGIALALTASFMAIELASGLIAGSLALIADAGHMLTDAAALALAWAAARIATRPADTRRSFGYQRLRVIAAFLNGCALLFLVAWIAIEAVQRLMNPAPVDARIVLYVGAAGFAINLIVYTMLSRHGGHDMNVSAAALHVMGDLLGSLAAIVAALTILWTGWLPIDPLLSLVVCALIVRSAWSLVRRSAHILMEGSPDWLDLIELRRTLETRIPAIRDVHHVHAWLVGPNETFLTMHASVVSGADHSVVLRDAKTVLAETFGITHATIQIEAEACVDQTCNEPRIANEARRSARS